MKKLLFVGALLCVLCSCGSGNSKKNAAPANVHEAHEVHDVHEVHEWVDLGLPSGLKWATCNLGASTPGDYGNYYAWGETRPKSEYWSDNCSSYGKTWSDIGGDSSRDAATANWGGSWRMPTNGEFRELEDNCTWTWTTQNGHKGYRVTGKNGQSIFLPAAGYRDRGTLYYDGGYGYYWSSSLDSQANGYHLFFNSGGVYPAYSNNRFLGFSVRAVQ
jgi:hypothetical protein